MIRRATHMQRMLLHTWLPYIAPRGARSCGREAVSLNQLVSGRVSRLGAGDLTESLQKAQREPGHEVGKTKRQGVVGHKDKARNMQTGRRRNKLKSKDLPKPEAKKVGIGLRGQESDRASRFS